MKKSILMLLPLVLLTAACTESLENEGPRKDGKPISFVASISTFTKATDNSFENGDEVSLSIGAPVGATAVKLTYNNGALTPDQALYWAIDQKDSEKSTFAAVSPYKASLDPMEPFDFTIAENQAAEDAYAASDLIAAVTEASPADQAVNLQFSHVLSRLLLDVSVLDYGDATVRSITLGGVKLGVQADVLNGAYTASGNPAVVTPAFRNRQYAFLVAPQRETPELLISLSTGETVRYIPEEALDFASGKQLIARIAVSPDAVTFTSEVHDWLDDYADFGEYDDGGQPSGHNWSVVGSMTDWNEYLGMEETEPGVFSLNIPYYNYDSFFIADADDADKAFGAAISGNCIPIREEESVEAPVSPISGYSIIFAYEGPLELQFIPAKGILRATSLPAWETIGDGIFIDGFVSDLFGYPHEEISVEVQQGIGHNVGKYRIKNPYANWSHLDEFDYTEGGSIIINATDEYNVYIEKSFLGLSDPDIGDIYGLSLVEENGYGGFNYYGYFDNESKSFRFYWKTATTLTKYKTYISNDLGQMTLILPGGSRNQFYYDLSFEFQNTIVKNGQTYARFFVTTQMDSRNLRYGVWYGHKDRETIINECAPSLLDYADGTVVVDSYIPDSRFSLEIPVNKTGTYTLLILNDDPSGNYYRWSFGHFGVVMDGDEAPEAQLSVTAAQHPAIPESRLKFHIDMQDPTILKYLVIPSREFDAAGLSQDDIYDYVLSNGTDVDTFVFNTDNGQDFEALDLKSETQYYVFAAGENNFGISAWDYDVVTTGSEPEWNTFGTGRMNDYSWMFGDYQSEVTILKAVNLDRYRVLRPYYAFWENPTTTGSSQSENYLGYSAEYFDFYLEGEEFIYTSFLNGFLYWYGDGCPIEYRYSPNRLNRQIAEGVYNFSPMAFLVGTNMYYNFTTLWEYIYLEMPGYSYTPSWLDSEGAPARLKAQSKPSAMPLDAPSFVKAQKEVKPMSVHMVKTGKPVVSDRLNTTVDLQSRETITK